LEWSPKSFNLYTRLNCALTSSERSSQAPEWRFYLRYLFNGLRKLPIWEGKQDLYRSISINLEKRNPQKYKPGKIITWYGFSSTTLNIGAMKDFLGDQEGTIFCINGAISGREIEKFSAKPDEVEVLLPPGSRFQIINTINLGKLIMIQLKQIKSLEIMLKME